MGDRCWLQLTVHGPINTMRHLSKITKAIAAENFDSGDESPNQVLYRIAEALAGGSLPEFEMQECNYANIDDVESVLEECGCAWSVDHSSGGDYPAGGRSWNPTRGQQEVVMTGELGSVVAVDELRKALRMEDPLAYIRELVECANMARARDLPEMLAVGEKVERYLAGLVADEALDLRKAS